MPKKPKKAITYQELSNLSGLSIPTLKLRSAKNEFSIWNRESVIKFLAKLLAIKAIEKL
jgi:hypothetical protein